MAVASFQANLQDLIFVFNFVDTPFYARRSNKLMITVYFKKDNLVEPDVSPLKLSDLDPEEWIWIDVCSPSAEEQEAVEKLVSSKFLTRHEAQEIETTSKYSESVEEVLININYFFDKGKTYQSEPISFILTREGFLVSYHHPMMDALKDVTRRIKIRPDENKDGISVFMTILETIIDYDADMEELLTREISRLSKIITTSKNIDKAILHRINELQEKTTALREDVYDIQRVLAAVIRSKKFPAESGERLTLMTKDVESLINHGDISFSRLDYLQDTAMGLINIEQNEIVKILSVAAVIFMPPTLIASIYGMNFKVMPELDWVWTTQNGWVLPAGYIFAIILMVAVTFITYWFFKFKKWL